MLVAGEAVQAADGQVSEALDPTTGQVLATVPVAGRDDVDQAVTAARRAFDAPDGWRWWSAGKRARALKKLAALCREQDRELVRIESMDTGMPRGMAKRFAVAALSKNLEYYASWADKLTGETLPQSSPDVLDYTRREPLGVVAAIIPWNTPLLFVGSKLGPALAAGNVVILKPSEHACLGALRVASLVAEAGFPPGVVQVLSGGADTGRALVEHPGIDLVSFTGGGSIAAEVQRVAAPTLKPVLFELGGKSPNVVFADADLDKAAFMSTMGVFGLSGQACAAGSRLLVEREALEPLLERMIGLAGGLGIGDPLDPFTMLGPLIHPKHADGVRGRIEQATAEGASLRWAGKVPEGLGPGFVAPHVFVDVARDSALWQEEVFGPVLAVTPFDSEAEARISGSLSIWTVAIRPARRSGSSMALSKPLADSRASALP